MWNQGLLLKGNGLVEGITGNGYALHSLARWYFRKAAAEVNDPEKQEEYKTKAQLWHRRALLFMKAMSDPEIQSQCAKHSDKQRMIVGISDHPFCLSEGLSGDLIFMSEMLFDDYKRARFPGYEIVL